MYPLHKYVRTPFGTYLMYINHGPERINIQSLPEDVDSFKKEHSRKPKQSKAEREKVLKIFPQGSNKELKKNPLEEVPPSYKIRFLQHNGQTVTEPPSNVIIVDDITGADIKSSMTWIRSRPKQWKERVEMHKIANPKMTSTLPKVPLSQPCNRSSYPAGGKLLGYRPHFDGVPMKEVSPPQVLDSSKHHPKLPKVDKTKHRREKAQYNREAREVAAQKRRRKADKIMLIVEKRAFAAKMEAQVARERTASSVVEGDRYSYLSNMKQSQLDSQFRRKMPSMEESTVDRSANTLSSRELMGRTTVHEEIPPPRIQDWNPREEQDMMNQVILQRMEKAMPYRWKEGAKETKRTIAATGANNQSNYTYVL